MPISDSPLAIIERWFTVRGWQPFEFQREAWLSYLAGESGLIHASTGTGKTYAAWLGPILEALTQLPTRDIAAPVKPKNAVPLQALWLTPLRALAADTEQALRKPISELGLPWTLEQRTGDTASHIRQRQKTRLPTALITTPESLSLLLSQPDAAEKFKTLQCVFVDEWHELLGSKRGVQVELCLARLRQWRPELRIWGLSATIGQLDMALQVLLGQPMPSAARIIRGQEPKELIVDSLIPETIERLPWAGQIGLRMLKSVAQVIDESASTLVFTNSRAQTEIWYQALLDEKPEWAGQLALHHGSLDRATRNWVEESLRQQKLRAVICTSSLDLGVDFSPVDRVMQLGSPKGVARLMQRAGRSGHQPGSLSRVTCVPTHAFELVEVAAARDAMQRGNIESKVLLNKPLDVLAQHLVTIAAGMGFHAAAMLAEVRRTYAYRELSDTEWQWVLDFVTRGGSVLKAYPQFRRVVEQDGLYKVTDAGIAKMHRLNIGTIVSEAILNVQYLKGAPLGTIEEGFVSRLKRGDVFTFAGKTLAFVMLKDNTVYVRRSKAQQGLIPSWQGTRMPLSKALCEAVRAKLEEARQGRFAGPEMQAVQPVLALQAARSCIPATGEFLIERCKTREGHHLYFFPFEGRAVHEGLSALFAYRLSRLLPITFTFAQNDYGFELLSPELAPIDRMLADDKPLFNTEHLTDDILAALNSTEMARRQFREIARIAGLVFDNLPAQRKTARQVQATSGLMFDTFAKYDPQNLLLQQANREVLERQLESSRLTQALRRLANCKIVLVDIDRPTPLAFPIMVDRLRGQLSSESLAERVSKMVAQYS